MEHYHTDHQKGVARSYRGRTSAVRILARRRVEDRYGWVVPDDGECASAAAVRT